MNKEKIIFLDIVREKIRKENEYWDKVARAYLNIEKCEAELAKKTPEEGKP